jgi:gamma-glutamylcyclotransferase (GGCT)/AIG2-like uncharacterized protein YtfP
MNQTRRRQYGNLDRPYFVYGTLRPAWGNSKIWQRHNATCLFDGEVQVSGFEMVDNGIPYARRTDDHDDFMLGALIVPNEDDTARRLLRSDLDSLEGWPGHYDRIAIVALTPHGPQVAWIYSPSTWDPTGRVEMTGDYANCERAMQVHRFKK